MTPPQAPNRCRIVLVTPPVADAAALKSVLGDVLAAGDIASVVIPQYDLDEEQFETLATALVEPIQAAGAAAMIAGESRVAFRVGADGIHVEGRAALADAMERHSGRLMVGTGGAKSRDDALMLGEYQPDYLFFGRFGYDNRPEPHARNIVLGRWWSEMTQVPCIVLGGSSIESAAEVARTGADFVALSSAVFADASTAAERVAEVNALLDAPEFMFDG